MTERREYLDENGRNPDDPSATRISIALNRLSKGNVSNVKSMGGGVGELRIDFGPGYRVYFGRRGDQLIILLGGGTKKRQQRDITEAISRWADYKLRS